MPNSIKKSVTVSSFQVLHHSMCVLLASYYKYGTNECQKLDFLDLWQLTSVTKISIPSTAVIHYWAWYTYFRNGRYIAKEPAFYEARAYFIVKEPATCLDYLFTKNVNNKNSILYNRTGTYNRKVGVCRLQKTKQLLKQNSILPHQFLSGPIKQSVKKF